MDSLPLPAGTEENSHAMYQRLQIGSNRRLTIHEIDQFTGGDFWCRDGFCDKAVRKLMKGLTCGNTGEVACAGPVTGRTFLDPRFNPLKVPTEVISAEAPHFT